MSALNLELPPYATPEQLRDVFRMLVRMLDAAKGLRADLAADHAPLCDRIEVAQMQHDIEAALWRVNQRLRKIARRGGRGVTP